MELTDFPEVNSVYAKDQPEYVPLPAYSAPRSDRMGRLVCCWRLSWWDRVRLLLTGLIWHQVLTFNQPLQPQLLTVGKPEMAQ